MRRLLQVAGLPGLLVFGLLLAGCSFQTAGAIVAPQTPALSEPGVKSVAAPDPEVAASRYLEAWRRGDLDEMYDSLSPLAQDGIGREAFISRHESFWRQAALSGLDFEIVSSLVNPQSAQVRYRVTVHSAVVGDLTRETFMELKRVQDEWRVAWTDAAILPELAEGRELFLDIVTPTRANVYDQRGLGLAAHADAIALWIVPNQIGDDGSEERMLNALSQVLDERPEHLRLRYEPFRDSDFFIPLGEVSPDAFQAVEATLAEVGGVQWSVYSGRFYLDGGLAPHAVGYVAQITEEALEDYQLRGYQGDEYVGQTGLEAAYEAELRGQPGGTLYLRNAEGQIEEILASADADPPYAVYTTLDRELQRQAQQAIAGFRGAIVVLQLDTGAVLTLVSSPGFDPNLFIRENPNSGPGLAELFRSPNDQPLLNRATSGLYPLGSVFKMVTMAAALESGFYTPESLYTCNGEFNELPGQPTLYDWTVASGLPDHGTITLVEGLARSCNPYFWHIGLDLFNLGLPSALPDMASAFGLGQETGIEISEAAGQVPNPAWKLRTTGQAWSPGDAVQLAIGQASLNITPLQVARFVAALGNGGRLYKPHLTQQIRSAEGEVRFEVRPELQATLPVSRDHLEVIREAMIQVVREPGGTARHRFLGLDLNLAGKTGTATGGAGEPHAWFAGYTFEGRPDRPDIAVVVVLENQGEGSEWAAPVFRRVIESYFFGRPFMPYPWESQIGVTRTPTLAPKMEDPEPQGTPTP